MSAKKDFMEKARAIADKAMEMSGEYLERGKEFIAEKAEPLKIRMEIGRLECELEALYAGYGKACYNDEPGKHTMMKAAIRERLNEIEALEAQLAECSCENEAVYCRGCGYKNDSDDDFCGKCGKKLKK